MVLSKWPLARVIQLYLGTDNLTRVISLRTITTQLTGPIRKLVILPVPIENSINLGVDGLFNV